MNRLKDSTSPYLLQHADNPVDWWPWCDEAFAEAARRDVPVMLSVGYAACHWCHVMAHESFEDPETAAVLNEHVVAVKVDREERPDVDAVYMTATQAMTGQGGWPMTVFMTPDAEPFFTGTYYPRDYFRQLVLNISQAWRDQRDDVTGRARHVATALAENARDFGIEYYDPFDKRQGIVHIIGPELGLTQPGLVILVSFATGTPVIARPRRNVPVVNTTAHAPRIRPSTSCTGRSGSATT